MCQVLLRDLEEKNDVAPAFEPFSGYFLGLTLVQIETEKYEIHMVSDKLEKKITRKIPS